jgi:hypothetical protein
MEKFCYTAFHSSGDYEKIAEIILKEARGMGR